MIKTKSAKAKGRRLQNWICEQISKLIGYEWGKDEPIAPREMGQSGVDVRLVGDARDAFPWSIEAKYQEKWNIPEWIQQAKKNRLPRTDWLLVVKKNRIDPIVILDAEVFFEILSLIPRHKKGR